MKIKILQVFFQKLAAEYMREIQISVSTEGKGGISQLSYIPFGSCLLVSQHMPPARRVLHNSTCVPAEQHGFCRVLLGGNGISGLGEFVWGFEAGIVVVLLVLFGYHRMS